MFSRSSSAPISARADRTRPSGSDASLSIVAADVSIRGDLTTSGELHLDGGVDGNIDARIAAIGESGRVSGDIRADALTVRGSVTGAITARTVRLDRTARVRGDISYASISIEAGAEVDGRFVHVAETPVAAPVQLLVVGGD